jgi:hypothetical protein
MHLSRVDLPEPLCPSRPIVVPVSISRLTLPSAHSSSCVVRPKWISRSFSVWYFSLESRNFFERSSTSIAGPNPAQSSSAKLLSSRPNT